MMLTHRSVAVLLLLLPLSVVVVATCGSSVASGFNVVATTAAAEVAAEPAEAHSTSTSRTSTSTSSRSRFHDVYSEVSFADFINTTVKGSRPVQLVVFASDARYAQPAIVEPHHAVAAAVAAEADNDDNDDLINTLGVVRVIIEPEQAGVNVENDPSVQLYEHGQPKRLYAGFPRPQFFIDMARLVSGPTVTQVAALPPEDETTTTAGQGNSPQPQAKEAAALPQAALAPIIRKNPVVVALLGGGPRKKIAMTFYRLAAELRGNYKFVNVVPAAAAAAAPPRLMVFRPDLPEGVLYDSGSSSLASNTGLHDVAAMKSFIYNNALPLLPQLDPLVSYTIKALKRTTVLLYVESSWGGSGSGAEEKKYEEYRAMMQDIAAGYVGRAVFGWSQLSREALAEIGLRHFPAVIITGEGLMESFDGAEAEEDEEEEGGGRGEAGGFTKQAVTEFIEDALGAANEPAKKVKRDGPLSGLLHPDDDVLEEL